MKYPLIKNYIGYDSKIDRVSIDEHLIDSLCNGDDYFKLKVVMSNLSDKYTVSQLYLYTRYKILSNNKKVKEIVNEHKYFKYMEEKAKKIFGDNTI